MRRYKAVFVPNKESAKKLMRKMRGDGHYATFHALNKGKKYVVKVFV